MKLLLKIAVLLCVFTGPSLSLRAQEPVPPPTPAYQPLSDAQLDQLLGPIALYPDPLIAEILPASTFPTQIVLADRYIGGGGDPNQINQQPWDPSVQAVARYPTVLKWMDDNLGETTELGQAFLNQQQDVMASIQRLRATASKLGNLQTTPQQQVTDDDGNIEIDPADADEMYVPDYQPDQVYYDSADGTPFITFGIGFPIGLWLDNDCDWGNGNIIVWNSGNPRPSNWWRQSGSQRNRGNTTVWRPGNHSAAAGTNHVDRGWGNSAPSAATVRADSAFTGTEPTHQETPQHEESSNSGYHPETAHVEHTAPISRPEADDALIGVESAHDTRTYSDRGQQSVRAMTPSHSAPAASHSSGGGGGGGGGHSGGGGGGGGGGGHKP